MRGLASENNTIRIGDNLPQGGQSNCYIGGVFDGVVTGDAFLVVDNADNKVGDTVGPSAKVPVNNVIQDP